MTNLPTIDPADHPGALVRLHDIEADGEDVTAHVLVNDIDHGRHRLSAAWTRHVLRVG